MQQDWQSPPFNATDFFAYPPLVFTVMPDWIETFRYKIDGRTMEMAFGMFGVLSGNGLSNGLCIRIPEGHSPAYSFDDTGFLIANEQIMHCWICPCKDIPYISIYPMDYWNVKLRAGNVYAVGKTEFEINA